MVTTPLSGSYGLSLVESNSQPPLEFQTLQLH
jgi:hypothetical protein